MVAAFTQTHSSGRLALKHDDSTINMVIVSSLVGGLGGTTGSASDS